MDLMNCISEATQEIFQSMLAFEVQPGAPMVERQKLLRDTVSGMVGMAGLYRGMLAIHVPYTIAKNITSTFLCIEVEDIDDDVKDAIGELANMLAGSVKSMLTDNGKDVKLAIPSAVCGREYEVECLADGDGVVVPFQLDGGEFLVECFLQK